MEYSSHRAKGEEGEDGLEGREVDELSAGFQTREQRTDQGGSKSSDVVTQVRKSINLV